MARWFPKIQRYLTPVMVGLIRTIKIKTSFALKAVVRERFYGVRK